MSINDFVFGGFTNPFFTCRIGIMNYQYLCCILDDFGIARSSWEHTIEANIVGLILCHDVSYNAFSRIKDSGDFMKTKEFLEMNGVPDFVEMNLIAFGIRENTPNIPNFILGEIKKKHEEIAERAKTSWMYNFLRLDSIEEQWILYFLNSVIFVAFTNDMPVLQQILCFFYIQRVESFLKLNYFGKELGFQIVDSIIQKQKPGVNKTIFIELKDEMIRILN